MKKIIKIIALFVIWQLVVTIFKIEPYLLPAPTLIFKAIFENIDTIMMHLSYTIFEALIGLGLAILISMGLAIIIDMKPSSEKNIMPFFSIFQTIPIVVIAPIFLIWFGFGVFGKIILVIIMCIYPILINILKGLKSIDKTALDFMKVINASKKDIYIHLKLPMVLPYFFAGLKITATYCISGSMFAEYVGAKSGIGIYLSRALTNFDYEMMFAIVVIVSSLTMLLLTIIDVIEKKVLQKYGRVNEKIN